MKRVILALCFVLALPACALVQSTPEPVGVDKAAPAAVQAAQGAINEGFLLVAAVADVVAANKRDGIITAAERDAYVAKLEKAFRDLEASQGMLDAGLPGAADKAGAVRSLLILLQREVAAKARTQ